jgi:hypothetical protein
VEEINPKSICRELSSGAGESKGERGKVKGRKMTMYNNQ